MSDTTSLATCDRCGQTLDRWGEHPRACYGVAKVVLPPKPIAAPLPFREFKVRDSRQQRMIALVSSDPRQPSSAASIAFMLGISRLHAGIALCIACKANRIQRVGRGRYLRAAA